jgi:hypothetical protein
MKFNQEALYETNQMHQLQTVHSTDAGADDGRSLSERPPNIAFLLMDNLGYGERGVYSGGILRGAPTPRINKVAAEGMQLLS